MGFQSKKQSANGMHCCPNCDSILVQPVSWHEQGDGWNVELRCPECEWWGQSSYSQDEVDRYEDEIDRGDQELMQDLRAVIRAEHERGSRAVRDRPRYRQHPPRGLQC